MTSPTSALTKRPVHIAAPIHTVRARSCQAFTLVELLVVIGIIVVLIGIITPATMKAVRQASRTATANDLQAISAALEAYKQDRGDYPRLPPVNAANVGYDGAITLCQALMAPGNADDKDTNNKPDLGFRL